MIYGYMSTEHRYMAAVICCRSMDLWGGAWFYGAMILVASMFASNYLIVIRSLQHHRMSSYNVWTGPLQLSY